MHRGCIVAARWAQIQPHKNFSTDLPTDAEYAREANEALESLSDKFSEVVEEVEEWSEADPTLADGVLTVKLGGKFGTYVINKQTPNKQTKSDAKQTSQFLSCWAVRRDGRVPFLPKS